MGGKILAAIINVIAKNPDLLEKVVEAGFQLLVSEMQKAVEKAKTPAA